MILWKSIEMKSDIKLDLKVEKICSKVIRRTCRESNNGTKEARSCRLLLERDPRDETWA